ncbi:uncharacterized protein K460DRAFT_396975 [Cucurbitaria berberidis CBS 394.84]|uniref:Uncharacterized protein n=1 Tax=Cucurbitaria berberidis CBS 394.84 TaxID=1168544 RepID=A0A9P4GEB8_9PLEO|nr:uncharacterized protein K460DRAFT_396975 [Cucurbitaria berberidis CBS 394.84]KAF1843746.1 hypothetical protein K460DRAFT_396975 [Cucurbitaria berberidis CBS 394.84]
MATEHAVNYAGARYDFSGGSTDWAARKPNTVIYVQTNGLSNASSKEVKGIGREEFIEKAVKPPELPVETEICFTSGMKLLFVGLLPSSASKHTRIPTLQPSKKGKATATDVLPAEDVIIPYDAKATRVVVPFGKTNVSFYSLDNTNEIGLCKGISVDGSEVFFFKEWRDDKGATSLEKRKYITVGRIRQAIDAKPMSKPNPINAATAQISARTSRDNEIVALISTYLCGGDVNLLERCKSVLDDEVGEGERNSFMAAFLRAEKAIDEATASELKIGIEKTWPSLNILDITSTELVNLSEGLVMSGLHMHPKYSRAFLVGAINRLRRTPGTDISTLVRQVLDDTKLQIGTSTIAGEELASTKLAPLRSLLDTIGKEVGEIRVMHTQDMENIKKVAGAHVTGDSLEVVMARLAVVPDVDTARLNISHLFRLVVEVVSSQSTGTDRRLRELQKQLESFRDGIDQETE